MGWFDRTLPSYELSSGHRRLFVNVDCDIYSAAIQVLRKVGPSLRPGAIIYFDEFGHREHELKALSEFLKASPVQLRLLAADGAMQHVAFVVT